jgi:spermidine synthase
VTRYQTVSLWPGYETRYSIERELVAKRTRFQQLEICDTRAFGRALFLDDKIQSAESDEHIYHETLVHPALIAHPAPRSVYIAGGGEGATLREALRHPSVERALMVDIDGEAIDFVKEHMGAWHQGAFEDPRTELVIGDARERLARSEETFDAIIVDVTDPVAGGPSYLLFTEEFYRLASARLNPGGLLSVQAESMATPLIAGHAAVVRTLGRVFPVVSGLAAFVPAFGEPWGFAVAGHAGGPAALGAEEVDARLAARGIVGRHYDGETHRHMLSLPKGVRTAIAARDDVITDTKPLILTS